MPSEGAHQQWSSTVWNRWIVALALIAAAPAAAAAQFTTFIARPSPVKDSIKAAVVAEQHAMSDSITHAQITDMKTWVDSAAGIAALPAVDTALGVRSTRQTTTSVSNGVVAPATASPLPFLLVIGGSAMLLGLALLRRPQLKPRRPDC
jgi:threonine synthase